jgi:hypothetical protein
MAVVDSFSLSSCSQELPSTLSVSKLKQICSTFEDHLAYPDNKLLEPSDSEWSAVSCVRSALSDIESFLHDRKRYFFI